jgi:hypothetical protein
VDRADEAAEIILSHGRVALTLFDPSGDSKGGSACILSLSAALFRYKSLHL